MASASIDFMAVIADDVQKHTDGLSRLALSAPEATLWSFRPREIMCLCPEKASGRASQPPAAVLELRALRVRYQCVHDTTHAANTLYGFFNLAFIALTIYEGAVCLYAGVVALFSPEEMGDMEAFFTLLWGTILTSKLIFICIIGDQMRVEVSSVR
ncbi:uncharacterized protein LOC127748769 [Frankliniella occidentalis]|uniref:Uncharacterized protein LOC127748769 n=1 Tax=Frankliniella occidentalis TaxID=133901 RepID=A0A9C6U1W4_FRAOC|nr:uncharacterized protein LOC127748769 [Frankliniella occidentalis]